MFKEFKEFAMKGNVLDMGSMKLLVAEDIPIEALKTSDAKSLIPPLHGALLKHEADVHLFERLVFMSRNSR